MGAHQYSKKKVNDCIALTFDDFSQLYGQETSLAAGDAYISQLAEDLISVLTNNVINLKEFEAEMAPLRKMEESMSK